MIQSIREIPNLEEFYINTSLYTKFSVNDADKDFVFYLLFNIGTIDCYCPDCNDLSVFKGDDNRPMQNHEFGSFQIEKKKWKATKVFARFNFSSTLIRNRPQSLINHTAKRYQHA